MRIYTKTGDSGTTGLFGGVRVDKDTERVEAFGSVDELNSLLGLSRADSPSSEIDLLLGRIQNDLFALGAELACAAGKEQRLPARLIDTSDIEALEVAIDSNEAELEPLANFILPGGSRASAALHMARTVCRRAERRVVSAGRSEPVRAEILVYLNRLSDLLFVLARRANQLAGRSDVLWNPRGE